MARERGADAEPGTRHRLVVSRFCMCDMQGFGVCSLPFLLICLKVQAPPWALSACANEFALRG